MVSNISNFFFFHPSWILPLVQKGPFLFFLFVRNIKDCLLTLNFLLFWLKGGLFFVYCIRIF
ncbi:hypothetical protein LEP1GSC193_0717 [Leptospira phage vB_LalZ_80412-LE1]|nr:hypothetical protein LEP1GSC193_0717 [Leptospira phage vB_LalZ_80412-LE1]